MKKFVCSVCGYVHEGDSAPERCPQCKVPAESPNRGILERRLHPISGKQIRIIDKNNILPKKLQICPELNHFAAYVHQSL